MTCNLQARCVNVGTFTENNSHKCSSFILVLLKRTKGGYFIMNKKDKWFKLRLSEEERELLKSKVEKVGYITQSDYIRKLITDSQIHSNLDRVKLNEIRRLAGLLGKNTGLLKMYIMELDEPNKKMIDKIISDNERLKKEIRQVLAQIKAKFNI